MLAAATGFASADTYKDTLARGNVTVIYATSADSEGWLKGPAPPTYEAFRTSYARQGFPEQDLINGMAIAHHDALAVLAAAARLGPPVPTAADVAAQFSNLVLAFAVRGAQGELGFPADAGGRAVGRGIPIRQLGKDVLDPPAGYTAYRVT